MDPALPDSDGVGEEDIWAAARLSSSEAVAVREAQAVQQEGRLFRIPFVSVQDYLFLLRDTCSALHSAGCPGLVFLAAAVSDFYVPEALMAEHKIQSLGQDCLTLTLYPVPKMLGEIKRHWAPNAFVVSFKLETDETLLFDKAKTSIERYGVNAVLANLLQRRFDEMFLVSPDVRPNFQLIGLIGGEVLVCMLGGVRCVNSAGELGAVGAPACPGCRGRGASGTASD